MLRAAAVAIATAAVCTASAGATATEPVLKVTGRTPLVIEGRGFNPGQLVRVTVQLRRLVVVRTPRADANGRFRTTVTRIQLAGAQRCAGGVVITARAGGAFVLWHPRGLPDCPSPPRPPSV
jgi:hypothetical protein